LNAAIGALIAPDVRRNCCVITLSSGEARKQEELMHYPEHQLLSAMARSRKELTKERLIGYVLAGVVNLGLIAGLIDGLAVHYLKHQPAELKVAVIQPQKQVETQPIPKPTMVTPKDTIAPPQIEVQTPTPNTIQQKVAPAAPSQAAAPTRANGITSTHTTPPYPPGAKSAGKEGKVILHIMISATGDVTSATVTKSSGVPELDQTAVSWVIAHWKYKPATDNGTAVASQSDAQVVFSLKNMSE
jgi:protein TonB